jgi:NADH:ubiquinone oxidoreductase subunit C
MEASLERENGIVNCLAERLGVDATQAVVKPRKIYLGVSEETFMDALKYLRDELDFDHLCTITGLDTGENYEFLYHVAEPGGIVLTLKFKTRHEDPVVIQSVLPIFNGATFYERELESLLGVKVEGLTPGRQYPLPDNWPKGQYPMRKDWKPGASQKNIVEATGAQAKLTDPSKGV